MGIREQARFNGSTEPAGASEARPPPLDAEIALYSYVYVCVIFHFGLCSLSWTLFVMQAGALLQRIKDFSMDHHSRPVCTIILPL